LQQICEIHQVPIVVRDKHEPRNQRDALFVGD
jgi:hypothetical protein